MSLPRQEWVNNAHTWIKLEEEQNDGDGIVIAEREYGSSKPVVVFEWSTFIILPRYSSRCNVEEEEEEVEPNANELLHSL